ncbi:FecR family protein [bacterium]|nr:FecR family protein [bacterium]
MMTRNEAENRILEFLEGELTPDEERELMAEVEANEEYKDLLEQYRRQDRELAAFFGAAEETLAESADRPDLSALPVARTTREPAKVRPISRWMAIAACAALLIAVGTYVILPWGNGGAVERVLASQGTVQAFEAEGIRSLAGEDRLPATTQRLKTANDGYLQLALANNTGSVELNANSLVRLAGSKNKPQFELERGELFVANNAAKESARPVRVDTREFRVESDGGTFSVVRGLRGAEVAVASGNVEVIQAGVVKKLGAGESYSSEKARPIPVDRRIAWTSAGATAMNADEPTLVAELPDADAAATTSAATMSSIDEIVSPYGQGVALTTDYLPEDTIVLVEIPSIAHLIGPTGTESLADVITEETIRTFIDRLSEVEIDEESAEQFATGLGTALRSPDVQTVLKALKGSVSLGVGENGAVLITDVRSDAAAVEEVINGKLVPLLSLLQMGNEQVSARVENGFLIIAIQNAAFLESLEAIRTDTPTDFAYSPFVLDLRNTSPHSTITGAVNVAGINQLMLEHDRTYGDRAAVAMQRFGLDNMRAIIGATDFGDQADNQAVRVTFDGERHGMVGWLDEPGAMGSIQFFSPDTHALLAMKVQSPEVMLEEVFGWLRSENKNFDAVDQSAEAELLRMVAATLGNEAAIGLDNPLLPIPNVKVAIEVLDPIAFHNAMLDLIDLMATSGDSQLEKVQVRSESYRGHLVVSFEYPGAPFGISYAVIDDYVIFGPGAAFVKNTIEMSEDGRSLENEYAFTSSLPAKSGSHVSMLLYQPFSKSAKEVAPLLQKLGVQGIEDLVDLAEGSENEALVAYAIAEDNSVDFFVEGFRVGDLEMTGWIPAVADWYKPIE